MLAWVFSLVSVRRPNRMRAKRLRGGGVEPSTDCGPNDGELSEAAGEDGPASPAAPGVPTLPIESERARARAKAAASPIWRGPVVWLR